MTSLLKLARTFALLAGTVLSLFLLQSTASAQDHPGISHEDAHAAHGGDQAHPGISHEDAHAAHGGDQAHPGISHEDAHAAHGAEHGATHGDAGAAHGAGGVNPH